MEKVRLTKEFSFEMAHALVGYDGACREIHGHSYRLFVTVEGAPSTAEGDPKLGMAVDFGDLKRAVNKTVVEPYDHSFMIRLTPESEEVVEVLQRHFTKIHVVDWQPTCENLLHHFAALIAPALPFSVSLKTLRLHETATSYAELTL